METHICLLITQISILFQSTPPRGWRLCFLAGHPSFFAFQSTPPRGWRLPLVRPLDWTEQISIHSTARVETPFSKSSSEYISISIHSTARVETKPSDWEPERSKDFNPLHREGGDVPCPFDFLRIDRFQSTPPRGWRLRSSNLLSRHVSISIHSTARVETFTSF